MINRTLKSLLRFFLILLFIIGILFVASKIIEKKVVHLMVEQINKSVEVPVYIDDIRFSLLKKFPYATLQLKNITIKSAPGFNKGEFVGNQADTLLFITDLYLAFNTLSLLHHEMELTKAYINNGFLNILADSSGKTNYSVFEQLKKTDTDTTGSFKIRLKAIELNQINVCFKNNFKEVSTLISMPSLKLKGEFYKEAYQVETSGSVLINEIKQGQLFFKPDVPAQLNLQFEIQNNRLSITKSQLNSTGLQLNTSGSIVFKPDWLVDLHISGNQIDIKKISRWVNNQTFKNLEPSGKLSFNGVVSGKVNEKVSPKITFNFQVAEGSATLPTIKHPLKNIEIKGSYTNGNQRNINTSVLNFDKLDATTETSSLTSQLKIQNFRQPVFTFDAGLNMNASDVPGLIPETFGTIHNGKITGNLHLQGEIPQMPLKLDLVRTWYYSGKFLIDQAEFVTSDKSFSFNQTSAVVALTTTQVNVENLKGNFQNTTGSGYLQLDNYWGLFSTEPEKVYLNTNLQLSEVAYPDITFLFTNSDTTESNYNLNVKATITASQYTQDKVILQKVKGTIYYANEQLKADSVQFKAFGGSAKTRLHYLFNQPGISKLQVAGKISSMDINQVLVAFDNFGQSFITDKHLSGRLTSDFDMEMKWINDKPDLNSIDFMGYVKIEQGRLQNFEPVKELALFSEIPELENVEFTKLENQLLISNGVVQVPQMDVQSNAFDVTLNGEQFLNGDYTYHLKFYLSDFLTGKAQRLKNQQTDYGWVEEDENERNRLYLLVQNKGTDFSVSVDKQAIKNQLKTGSKNEKKEFKKALHDEFGWFKKDSTLNQPAKNETKKPVFTIEWDEE